MKVQTGIGGRPVGLLFLQPRHWTEVGVQRHPLVALPRERKMAHISQEAW